MAWWGWQDPIDTVLANQRVIISMLQRVLNQETKIMATIADVQASVANETTVVGGVVTLLNQLSDLLKAAIASNDPVALQAVVDSINANATTLAAAVTKNTPAASSKG